MDPTLAALLGTVVGSVIGVVGTWTVPSLTARHERKARLQADRRAEVAAVDQALIAHLKVRLSSDLRRAAETRATVVAAAHRLMMLAPRRDRELDSMIQFALDGIDSTPKVGMAAASVNAASTVLVRWYRGEVSGTRIGDAYAEELDRELRRHERPA